MSNEDSGLFVILTAIGGAVIGALGGALIMNTETGKKTDAHLSNAYKQLRIIFLERGSVIQLLFKSEK